MATKTADAYAFKAEIKQLLNILVHSLYKDREIFLRELISNASDALTRVHFEMLTNRDVVDPDAELAIHIDVPEVEEGEQPRIVVRDSGVGMTRDELVQNLGTIAQSGAREFLAQVSEGDMDPSEIIGQFGVGFYSIFMAADRVRVVSRSYRPEAEAAAWTSDGSERFTVEEAEKEERGTEIHIFLKKDAEEFANAWRLKQIVSTYSDFVRFPIYVGEEQANQQESLWRKRPSQVEEEDYKSFYQQMTMDFEEPLLTLHFSSDAPINVRALLFVPAKREQNVLAARKEPGVMLYSHNVLIQEYCTDLLPEWLGFVDGVVDSEDLPLNVSRETVQNNRLMRRLGALIKKRLFRELDKMAEEDPERYETFWHEFGRAFKEGIATDPAAKDEVMPYLRYYSSEEEGLTSLHAYIERMPDSQEQIYYVLGDDRKSAAHSPHLDPLRARGLEALYWVDPLDSLIAPMMQEYEGKSFQNIDDADLELPESEEAEAETADSDGDDAEILPEKEFNQFVGRCVTTLGDRVIEVRASKVLKDNPVRLVSPKDAQNREMHRIYRFVDENYEIPKKIMEVNRRHPLVADLAHLIAEQPDSPFINLSIEQLYESALVQEGLHPNPAEMLPRIQELMQLAAAAQTEKS